MSDFEGFPKSTLKFLKLLRQNNNRDWFAEHKEQYEQAFLKPALEFITAMQKPLGRIAPLLSVEPKKSGGSLMRIYKDTRFSRDKTPYKTNIGIHFRHAAGKDVHAPGAYLHISPEECFFGAGIWMPPADALRSIREHLVANPSQWKRVKSGKSFQSSFELAGERLKTAPRGFDREHPQIDDLRFKSFIGIAPITKTLIESDAVVPEVTRLVKASAPLMVFLCEALNQPY